MSYPLAIVLSLLTVLSVSFSWAQQDPTLTSMNKVTTDDSFIYANVTEKTIRTFASTDVTFASVQSNIHQWFPVDTYSSIPDNTKVWSKLTIKHTGQSPIALSLVASAIDDKNIEAYVVDKNQSIKNFYDKTRTDLDKQAIYFELMPNESVSIYVSLEQSGPIYLPLTLWESTNFSNYHSESEWQHTLFIGMLFGLACYFFFTYFVQRNASRFWYSISLTLSTLLALHLQDIPLSPQLIMINQPIVALLLSLLILMSISKVSHYLLARTPVKFKTVNYILPPLCGLICLLLSAFSASVLVGLTGIIWTGLQCYLCIKFHDRRHTLPAVMLSVCWVLILFVLIAFVGRFLMELPVISIDSTWHYVLTASALIFAGIAIETNERGVRIREFNNQEKRIANLSQFYHLFRNSAEGLYTSSKRGDLLSVNPAMCQLFGYAEEKTMLAECSNTASFYAHKEDRDVLLQDLAKKKTILGREIKGKRKDGSEFWFSISCQLHWDGNEEFLYGSIFDVTERKQSSLSLEYLATHDSLTGVLNRREFESKLQQSIDDTLQHKPTFLLYLDLDRFKIVNDACGHQAGDELIKNVAHIIQHTVDTVGDVARLGGDEFAVICQSIDEDSAYLCANKLLQAIQDYRFFYDNKVFTVGVSIGFLQIEDNTASIDQLLSMADSACYIAKEQGRNRIHRYSPNDMSVKRYESELNWLNLVNEALEKDNFILYCQPYQSLKKQSDNLHFEVLLRMRDAQGNVLSPSDFLPTAERYNLGAKIDLWVIENTLKWLSENQSALQKLAQCNINLSGQSLANKELKLAILNAFEKYSIPYSIICFEITETMAIVRLDETLEFIKTFRQLGSRFALDDFGSGFSSYAYLKNLPVDCVKIDGGFVKELLTDPVNQAMVSSISEVAKAMKMETVAEFVEDEATLIELGKIGVDFAQGYFVSKPLRLDELLT